MGNIFYSTTGEDCCSLTNPVMASYDPEKENKKIYKKFVNHDATIPMLVQAYKTQTVLEENYIEPSSIVMFK